MSVFKKRAKIISNRRFKGKFFHCILHQKAVSSAARPGQFLNVKVSDSLEPLLRRPISIHRVKGQNIELLYEALGKGTEILSQRKQGEYLDVLGPLGKGFSLSGSGLAVIVAGGMGVAPLLYLAQILRQRTAKTAQRKPIVLIGARTKKQVLCAEEFKKLGCEVQIATDDGSAGFKGKVTKLLTKELDSSFKLQASALKHAACNVQPVAMIYACGPRPMLKEISRLSVEYALPSQISLEEHMACGIGACLGCVVKTRDEGLRTRGEFVYKRVCKEGPVFQAKNIIWD